MKRPLFFSIWIYYNRLPSKMQAVSFLFFKERLKKAKKQPI